MSPVRRTVVESAERVGPAVVRVVLAGDDLADLDTGGFTDAYVKARFDDRVRSFTVRAFDPGARRLTLDFVVHGDAGLAGPWAARAKAGDVLELGGAGGGYAPDPEAPAHLLVGDECVLPAIASSLEAMPAGAPVQVVAEVHDAADEIALPSPGDVCVIWAHRAGGETMLRAVEALDLPPAPQLFVHGEAGAVRAVRRHLLVERALPQNGCSISGYWKRGRDDEGWRAEKPEWKRLVEADSVAA